MYINFDLPGDITPIVTPVHFLSIPSLQVCFHHMSYNQCFDVNSERKKEKITGNLI